MLTNYIKIAFKVLMRRKVFTIISLLGISITLAVLLVLTALLDHALGPMPPEVHADRTLGIYGAIMRGEQRSRSSTPGYLFLDQYVRTLPDVEAVTVFSVFNQVQSYQTGERTLLYLKRTDGAFWDVLNFEFLEGSPYTDQDDRQRNMVAVINASTRRRFFGDKAAVGQILEADGQRFRVVGVVADVPIFRIVPFADIWVPTQTMKAETYRDEVVGGFMAAILAHDRRDLPLIQDELQARLPQVPLPEGFDHLITHAETFPAFIARTLSGEEDQEGDTSRLFLLVGLLMVFFMVLPAVNMINLNMSRIMERASEIGMRKAFGASSRTLVGQFIVENLVITLLGGLGGLLMAYAALYLVSTSSLIPYAAFGINFRIFGYALLITVFFGVLSGVFPAWRMSRFHPVEALRRGA